MNKKTTTLCIGGLGLLLAAAPAVAHHAFGAEFDRDAPIRIEGKITRLEWVNPHTWVHIAVSEMVIGGSTVTPSDCTTGGLPCGCTPVRWQYTGPWCCSISSAARRAGPTSSAARFWILW